MRELTVIEHNLVSAGTTQSESKVSLELSRPVLTILFACVGGWLTKDMGIQLIGAAVGGFIGYRSSSEPFSVRFSKSQIA